MRTIKKFLKRFPLLVALKRAIAKSFGALRSTPSPQLRELRNLILFYQTKSLQASHPNPLNRFGKKCFSQTDEDGITLEILRRIDMLENGTFVEFGVGDGTENNTLILAALGWSGFWVGGEELRFKVDKENPKFSYMQQWVSLDNIVELMREGVESLGLKSPDVISLDLDGNDFYLIEELLNSGYKPKLFIVEYNAKFPPPVKFKIAYNKEHFWQGDDYFGASLSSFCELIEGFGYMLVCCNSHTGANAFFVDSMYAEKFADVPKSISEIYVEPRYHLYSNAIHQTYGHKISNLTLNRLLNDNRV